MLLSPPTSGFLRRTLRLIVSCVTIIAVAVAIAPAQEAGSGRQGPPQLFSTPLPDVPGHHLEVVELSYPPKSDSASTVASYRGDGHHHPGSVYVYVTLGAIRIGVDGDVTVVEAGGSFFEPPHAHHMFTESASATEGARAIAVMIVPDGEPAVVRGSFK